jgi:hypothetical protein
MLPVIANYLLVSCIGWETERSLNQFRLYGFILPEAENSVIRNFDIPVAINFPGSVFFFKTEGSGEIL